MRVSAFRGYHVKSDDAAEISVHEPAEFSRKAGKEFLSAHPRSLLSALRPDLVTGRKKRKDLDSLSLRAQEELQKRLEAGDVVADEDYGIYLYRLVQDAHVQIGIGVTCHLDDWRGGKILPHEAIIPERVEEVKALITGLDAHPVPVQLAFEGRDALDDLIDDWIDLNPPTTEFEDEAARTHALWRIDGESAHLFLDEMELIESAYIIDGHHRVVAAADISKDRLGSSSEDEDLAPYHWISACFFSFDQLELETHVRVIHDLGQLSVDGFLCAISKLLPLDSNGQSRPEDHFEACLYAGGAWHTVRWGVPEFGDLIDSIDSRLLEIFILEPLLDLREDSRSDRISYLPGDTATSQLETLVDSGEAAVVIRLYPPEMAEVIALADAGEEMPAKTTCFEPKPRSGLFMHRLELD